MAGRQARDEVNMKHKPRMSGTETQEMTVEHGDDIYVATLTIEWHKEKYGEDADGNRYEWRTYSEVTGVGDIQKNGVDIKEADVPKEVMEKFEAGIDK
jgi:hypothetical protein